MRVRIDKSKCYGCGSCVAIMPEMFEIGYDGLAIVKSEYENIDIVDPALIERLKLSKESCPNGAVILE